MTCQNYNVLSDKEKRFIKYWEEQRTGGRWSYFALYIPVGTFLCGVFAAFLFSMVSLVGKQFFLVIGITSALLATAITLFTWFNNEKKFKAIIRREVEAGRESEISNQKTEV